MRNEYCIIKQSHSTYNAIVVGLSRTSLTDYFEEIATDLMQNKITGKILLDYYNYNHSSKRRFFEFEFINNTIPINNIKKVQNSDVIELINKSYKNTPELTNLCI